MYSRFVTVTCPSCCKPFEIAVPPEDELPVELDYDCEICCRPMVIRLEEDGGDVRAETRGISE